MQVAPKVKPLMIAPLGEFQRRGEGYARLSGDVNPSS